MLTDHALVIPPRSGLIGQPAFPGMVTESGDLVVPAMQRKGEELAGESRLAVGDTLLLRGRGARSTSISPIATWW